MSTEIKYEIKPFQDSPGTPTVKVFLRDLRNLGNKKGDDFGWTLTDNLDGVKYTECELPTELSKAKRDLTHR